MTGSAGATDVALVVGVGNPDRGDDGVGRAVAALVRGRALPGVEVAEVRADPTVLLDLWEDRHPVVLVDAVCSGASAGTLVELDLRRHRLPRTAIASTHGFGVAEVVELGRALGRLPAALVFVGVEVGDVGLGAPISAQVLAGMTEAANRVAALLRPAAIRSSPARCSPPG